jgi:hypothetical protein
MAVTDAVPIVGAHFRVAKTITNERVTNSQFKAEDTASSAGTP